MDGEAHHCSASLTGKRPKAWEKVSRGVVSHWARDDNINGNPECIHTVRPTGPYRQERAWDGTTSARTQDRVYRPLSQLISIWDSPLWEGRGICSAAFLGESPALNCPRATLGIPVCRVWDQLRADLILQRPAGRCCVCVPLNSGWLQ